MSQPIRILLALALGLILGAGAARLAPASALWIVDYAEPVGTAWLNALRMTIVPLVVALLVTGIAATAEAARASRLAGNTIALIVTCLVFSAAFGCFVSLGLLEAFPLGGQAAAALRGSFAQGHVAGAVPSFAQFVASLVPTNVLSAAANDAFLPLILFTTVFAFAVTRLPPAPRTTLRDFFKALADTMLIMIHWVLWLAPIGVLALAYVVGARAGTAAFGALLHYVLIVAGTGALLSLLAYPFAMIGGRLGLLAYVRAIGPAQAVAISTESSIACLPAMLGAAERLRVPVAVSGVTLPLAVALFRYTGPAMNVAVAVYVSHVFGIHLGPLQIAGGIATAALTSLGSVSLPGQISFISSIAPIAVVFGVPVEPLAILVAVETLPDIVRTLGNVMMDVALTATIARRTAGDLAADEGDTLVVAER